LTPRMQAAEIRMMRGKTLIDGIPNGLLRNIKNNCKTGR